MKTTANISRPSYSQQAMRRHRAGAAPGAPACAGWAVRAAGGAADIRATGERLGSYWGYRPGRAGVSAGGGGGGGRGGGGGAGRGGGGAIGVTGAATRGEWSMTGGILGAFGR